MCILLLSSLLSYILLIMLWFYKRWFKTHSKSQPVNIATPCPRSITSIRVVIGKFCNTIQCEISRLRFLPLILSDPYP